jgi:flagellar biosynthesis chaperone FliJ
MAYQLQRLLDIRQRREERAASELTSARREVVRAQQRLEARKNDLKAYEETKEARRDRIFDAIEGRAVTRDDLDRVREGVARIDEEGILKADHVVRAEQEVRNCREKAERSRQAFVAATKNRMKIAEHREIWQRLEESAFEHRQESELEDFTGKKVVDDAAFDGD